MNCYRDYLLYTPVRAGVCRARLFQEGRLYDVAMNDYSGAAAAEGCEAEFYFSEKLHKWPAIAANLNRLPNTYRGWGFIDDDIEVDTQTLNELFQVGEMLQLDLYQPALTQDSACSHVQLKRAPGSYVRSTPFVEIMSPFMSRRALGRFRHLFARTESGWGLDLVWSRMAVVEGLRMGVVDALPVRHAVAPRSRGWRLRDGSTPPEEMRRFVEEYMPK
jgi:hypothetical protein